MGALGDHGVDAVGATVDSVVDGAENVGHGGFAGGVRDQHQEAALAGGCAAERLADQAGHLRHADGGGADGFKHPVWRRHVATSSAIASASVTRSPRTRTPPSQKVGSARSMPKGFSRALGLTEPPLDSIST